MLRMRGPGRDASTLQTIVGRRKSAGRSSRFQVCHSGSRIVIPSPPRRTRDLGFPPAETEIPHFARNDKSKATALTQYSFYPALPVKTHLPQYQSNACIGEGAAYNFPMASGAIRVGVVSALALTSALWLR